MIVVLDSIRSKYNVGSIFRTSDAIGIEKVYLCGITPCPIDKYGRKDNAISKVSLGAEEKVSWERCKDVKKTVFGLKKQGNKIISLEQTEKSIPYYRFNGEYDQIALILGNEVEGVSKDVIDLSDKIIEIPMKGSKESLNVSVAFGIVAFGLQYGKI